MTSMPWGSLFGLLFMTMGPIRAIAVFARVGPSDDAPEVRALATRASLLVAAAFLMTVLVGNAVLANWGVSFPALIAAGGAALFALSLQALLQPTSAPPADAAAPSAAAIAFPGLFPPIAVSIPLIFSVPFPGRETKAGLVAMGLSLVLVNWLLMRRSKAILRRVGPVPLQLFGAVFGVLQFALALQFLINATQMIGAQ
ncbi:MarC family protein [Rhodobacter sp. CZR27]|uniref:MarC family protein n=1 Tax=Rhodobacter sp. CZR27 TaxID=2033869 RepID=UPI000BBEBFC4|nr:MarC family protein [Rhodobacter sp. CZR27]